MSEMHKKLLSTDRWPNRAVSPFPFDANKEGLPVVLVHPGWGKRPEMHSDLLKELADKGFWPIGIDTRYGYADQGLAQSSRLHERLRVGTVNPYFQTSLSEDNRYFYRRPTGLLQACEQLGIEEATFVGHSEGARVGIVAALAEERPIKFTKMVLINGVGTGKVGGVGDLLRANLHAVKTRRDTDASTTEALRSFRDSAVHFITHIRRTRREAVIIEGYDAWRDIGKLALTPGLVIVVNAQGDHLISYTDAQTRSREHPNVKFIPTEGSHSNVYDAPVRNLIVSELVE